MDNLVKIQDENQIYAIELFMMPNNYFWLVLTGKEVFLRKILIIFLETIRFFIIGNNKIT